ncbi:MAG: hypothetical protein LC792_08175, partial [Actinobacteria bacterium]|nr:hypothetical protein [Actinomycetota bacterium]
MAQEGVEPLVLAPPLSGRGEDGRRAVGAQAEVFRHSVEVVVNTLLVGRCGVVALDQEPLARHFGGEIACQLRAGGGVNISSVTRWAMSSA